MNANYLSDDDDLLHGLSQTLQTAVDTMRDRPVPAAALARSLARASAIGEQAAAIDAEALAEPVAHERPGPPEPAARARRTGWRRHIVRGAGILAAVVLVATLLPTAWRVAEPRTSWAQVVAAVKARPWIHLVAEPEKSTEFDSWIDLAHNRTVWRRNKYLYREDLNARLHETYDPASDTILRTPLESEGLKMEAFGAARMFTGLLDAIPEVGSWYGIDKVVARRDAEVVENGHKWIDFTLDFEHSKLVLRVDPATRLPARISMQEGREAGAELRTMALEYPAQGPADIYAFGAPRTAKVLDCRPAGEVAKIRASLAAAQQSFGDYVAHAVKLHGGRPTEVWRYWRSGKRFRIEMVRAVRPEKQIPGVELPVEGAAEAAWITALDGKLHYVPVQMFDGTVMYQCPGSDKDPKSSWVPFIHPGPEQDIDRWIFRPFQSGMPHNYLFPEINYLYEVRPAEFADKPDDGPEGSVRLTAHVTETFPSGGASQEHVSKHWFDPQRGFACLKHYRTEAARRDGKQLVECYELVGFRQNPRGVWYPTIVRRCDDEGNAIAGERSVELRLYFNFDRPIPAEAFGLSIEPLKD